MAGDTGQCDLLVIKMSKPLDAGVLPPVQASLGCLREG